MLALIFHTCFNLVSSKDNEQVGPEWCIETNTQYYTHGEVG